MKKKEAEAVPTAIPSSYLLEIQENRQTGWDEVVFL